MIIEIKGVEFENKGSHLMLVAIIQQLNRRWPNAEIALTASAKACFADRASVASFRKLNLRKHRLDFNRISYFLPLWLRGWLNSKGVVTEVDINMIIDASGFSYSDQWPSKIRIIHLRNELRRFHLYSKPYIFLPQAFGPFTAESSRRHIASSLHYAAMICAREDESHQHLEKLTGALPNLFKFGDFTNLCEGFVPSSFDVRQRWACIVPNKNMLNIRNTNAAWLRRYEIMLVEAIKCYRERGLKPFFLNHEGVEDGALISRVNGMLDEPIPVIAESDPLAVKGIIGVCEAVFSSRFHGCISAMSQGIACVGTSWSHKYVELYDQYAASSLLLQPENTYEDLKRIIDLSLDKDSKLHRRIANQAMILKSDTLSMWQRFHVIVQRYSGLRDS